MQSYYLLTIYRPGLLLVGRSRHVRFWLYSHSINMFGIRSLIGSFNRQTNVLKIGQLTSHHTKQKYSTGKELKRFYKNVTISQAEGGFEVNLDRRKLKTPMGTLFQVPTEPLALAAAAEWDAQEKIINRHNMLINLLCNTAIDNPTRRSRDVIIDGMLEYLDTDTVCYRLKEPEQLAKLQTMEWDPLIHWVKERYGVDIQPTTGIEVPHIPEHSKKILKQHLDSYNDWALFGYQQVVENLKSLILALALIDRHLTVERAVYLSRLELEYQIQEWGKVEWQHDVDCYELRARIAAGTLFVHLTSGETKTSFRKNANMEQTNL